MAQQWVDLPLPRTINSDGGTIMQQDEAVDIYNILTHEPGQIRQRKGYARLAKLQGTSFAQNDAPAQIMTSPNLQVGASNPTTVPSRALVTLLHNQSGKCPPYRVMFPTGPYPSGTTELVNANVSGVLVNADSPGAVTTSSFTGSMTSTGTLELLPYTSPCQFDNSVWSASVCRVTNRNVKTGTTLTSSALVRWAGQNRAAVSVTANVVNGSTAVTLSAAQTPSLAGTFMNFGNDPTGKRYNYYVLTHVAGTAAVTLLKPFGLGDTSIPNHAGFADTALFSSLAYPMMSPPDIQCCIPYLSRMFVGRLTVLNSVGGIFPGHYPNAIAWSDVSEPEKWTDTNLAVLDSNLLDPVMGFGLLPNALVIFRRYSIWTMTGSDETNFTFRKVSSELGCMDSRSVTQYRDGVFFMADQGLFYYDGYQFQSMSQPTPGHGINDYTFRSDFAYFKYDSPLAHQTTTIVPRTDFLLMMANDQSGNLTSQNHIWALHIPTQSWTRFNVDSSTGYSVPNTWTKPGMHLNNACAAVTQESVVQLDRMFENEYNANQAASRFDESYNPSTGATVSNGVRSAVTMGDLRPFNGGIGRLHRLMFEHSIVTDTAGGITGYQVFVGRDPLFFDGVTSPQSITVGFIQPRYTALAQQSNGVSYRFSTELAGTTWPIEGSTFRIAWDTTSVAPSTYSMPPKILGLRALLEPTDDHVTDNPVT